MQNNKKVKERKLNFALVPDGCWKLNLRSILTKKEWDLIKELIKNKAEGKCCICGKKTKFLDAHECWLYNEEKGIQILDDIIAVCKDCHSVIHIGRTQLVGNIEKAEKHYMKVNNCSYAEFCHDLGIANQEHLRRNKVSEWMLDVSKLKNILNNKTTI